jgi:energy-coupling factor transport system ATP-binding protein
MQIPNRETIRMRTFKEILPAEELIPAAALPPRPAISLRDVSFSFFSRSDFALRNINLDILRGQFVIITGPSGCGKSVLAAAMAGFITHGIQGNLQGEIIVNGRSTQGGNLSSLAVQASLCQQDPEAQLCTLRVSDEVAFGPENLGLPPREVVRRLMEALSATNSLHLKDRSIFNLSGGEKQRVAIASMLAMQSNVVILDEPTSSLDPVGADEVLAAIEGLRRREKITVVVIEHRLERLLKMADRLIVMDAGTVAMDGNPGEVYERYRRTLDCAISDRHLAPCRHKAKNAKADEVICVRDLQFSYNDHKVLQNISFSAREGELIGIIGPNGSGKTTFLKCLAGLCHPSSGVVRVDGINVAKARVSEMARSIGFVFQNPNHQIFENTVLAEVMFACKNLRIDRGISERCAWMAMEEYGIIPYAQSHPLMLSYGEKRRLNICAALPHNPGIILLDEPFIGQDISNRVRIIDELLRLRNCGKTLLIVSHDMNRVFRYCDRIVFFKAGSILVDETPSQALGRIKNLGAYHFLPDLYRNDHQVC